MTQRSSLYLILSILLLLFGAGQLRAQDYPDSRGKDFWFTWMPNFHNRADSLPFFPEQAREHRLYVFIGANEPATGEIVAMTQSGVLRRFPFTIADPTKLHVWSDFYAPYELLGFQQGSDVDFNNNQCEQPVELYMHITSDVDVSVYALNQAQFTSDAFMVLPTDALGTDYVVMSYPSSGSVEQNTTTPSQFVVMATEDGTNVTIDPRVPTLRNGIAQQQVMLNRGQSYLVQADTRVRQRGDLTGTMIIADKPIAVFGGHQRTVVPIQNSSLSSRDCLVEQLNPVTTWGRRSFIAPFPRSSDEEFAGNDVYRVLARFDSTVVMVNDAEVAVIDAGEFYEAPLLTAVDVRTSRPVLVAQYKKTSSTTSSGSTSNVGDPLMMLVPPNEEFMNAYTFTNVQSMRRVQNQLGIFIEDEVYKEQYITVVMPAPTGAGTSSADYYNLQLDGVPITPAVQSIGQSRYVYFTQRMADGVHRIACDTSIGLYVFGYGQAVSYGYIGGMSFRPLDVYPPSVDDTVFCQQGRITVSDTLLGDKGVFTITVDAQENVTIGPYNVMPGTRNAVDIPLQLTDPTKDGFVAITAKDVLDQVLRRRVDLPGRTVAPVGHDPSTGPQQRQWEIAIKQRRCDTIRLANYGRFAQTITTLAFTSGTPVNITTPYVLKPGDTVDVITCRRYDTAGVRSDKLVLALASDNRACATDGVDYTIKAKTDEQFPRVTRSQDSCARDVQILVRDDDAADFGLEYVRVVDSLTKNCNVNVVDNMPLSRQITFSIIDPYDDAMYYVEASDSAGNRQVIADTIYGFTLEMAGVRGPTRDSLALSKGIGGLDCHVVPVRNYGIGTITLDRIFMAQNRRFSMPPGQFPIVLRPGDSADLVICYEPTELADAADRDSLVLTRNCLPIRLDVYGQAVPAAIEGVSRCDVPIEITILRSSVALPMPASSDVTFALSVPITGGQVRLINVAGIEVARHDIPFGTPTRALRMDVSDIPDGVYSAVIAAPGTTITARVVVRH
ncbi:MAG: T9SS type A sorting domain-containing protein [Candidatus Kapabacteria bacterium]|nr:T9SS type A sorting domain-containing protein [Candidatus Kapabacteria bacterium]